MKPLRLETFSNEIIFLKLKLLHIKSKIHLKKINKDLKTKNSLFKNEETKTTTTTKSIISFII